MKISTHLSYAGFLWIASTLGGFFFLRVTDPTTASVYKFVALYAIVFAWIFSGGMLGGYVLRTIFLRRGVRFDFLRASERQGILLGLLGISSLILSSYSFLNLWTVIPLLFTFFMIELYSHG